MNPLLAVRSFSSSYVSDLLWPAVTESLLIRLEPGEVVRWRGQVRVLEKRWSAERATFDLAWQLSGLADCLITDRRLTYLGRGLRTGEGAGAAGMASLAGSRRCRPGSVLAGQVRFQWADEVTHYGHLDQEHDGVHCTHITIRCQERTVPVVVFISVKEAGASPGGDRTGTAVARALVSDIARFRLATRAGQLPAEVTAVLAGLRDQAAVEPAGVSRWKLGGALRIGVAADPEAYRQWLAAKRDQAIRATSAYASGGKLRDLEAMLRISRELTEDSAFYPSASVGDRNRCAAALAERFRRRGDLADLSAAIGMFREAAGLARESVPGKLQGVLLELGQALSARWKKGFDPRDLAEATAALEESVTLAEGDPGAWAPAMAILSQVVRASYPVTDDPAILDRAVGLCEEILRRLPDTFAGRGKYQATLGFALLDRHRVSARPEDARRAVTALRAAMQAPLSAGERVTTRMALAEATARLDGGGARSPDRVEAGGTRAPIPGKTPARSSRRPGPGARPSSPGANGRA